ncbi:hypothetical protein NLC35_01120 [Candidatus Aminicenantes bacterium AC-334-K16]|mgnify:CR=1 FL=1|jgi:cellulose synthase/poly-beta-1,6-N-acetylglucosamine synthase-like glycosyltransferase|nr:hypothetical protein [Candidatus Aminicenantes bacterium AC-334-K16]
MKQSQGIKKARLPAIIIELSALAFSIWLLYPLIFSSALSPANAKSYFFRTIIGLLLLLILFGKAVTDLFFPQGLSRQVSKLKSFLLLVYSLLLASSILYIAGKLIVLYFRSTQTDINI